MNFEDFRYNNVVIAPSMIVNTAFAKPTFVGYFSINKQYLYHFKRLQSCGVACSHLKARRLVEHECIYGGIWYNQYGHFITETLCNAYFIKRLPENIPIVFNSAGDMQIYKFQRDILDLLCIKNRILFIEDVTQFKTIYLPPPGQLLGSFLTDEQINTLGVIDCAIDPDLRLYISRKNMKSRKVLNEDKVEEVLISHGWQICYPEKMTIKDQLSLYAQAGKIFSFTGSALHSLLFFIAPAQHWIVVPAAHDLPYEIIADAKTNTYTLFNLHRKLDDPEHPNYSSSCADIEQLKKILDETNEFTEITNHPDFFPPQKAAHNYHILPKHLLNNSPKASIAYSLFYRVLYAYNIGKDIEIGKKCLLRLLESNIFDAHMIRETQNFLKKYWQDADNPALVHLLNGDRWSLARQLNNPHSLLASYLRLWRNNTKKARLINRNIKRPMIEYQAHISNIGWTEKQIDGYPCGSLWPHERIEAIQCYLQWHVGGVEYSVYTNEDGWLYAKNGEMAGNVGKFRRIHGLRIKLINLPAWTCLYRIRHTDGDWTKWQSNGDPLMFTDNGACALEIRIEMQDISPTYSLPISQASH